MVDVDAFWRSCGLCADCALLDRCVPSRERSLAPHRRAEGRCFPECVVAGDNITPVSTPYELQLVQDMRPLCGPLQDALSTGVECANRVLTTEGLERPERDWLRHHIARTKAHEELLKVEADLDGWKVSPVRNNGAVMLRGPRNTVLRLLHEGSGRIPNPGSNRARRAFYAQGLLGADEAIPTLESQRLIASWFAPNPGLPDITVNIFRPYGTFKFGSPGKADMAFPLPYEADDLDALEWTSSDEGIDLPIPGEGESDAEPADG